MNWTKLITINFSVLIVLLLLLESGARMVWTLKTCMERECDYSRLSQLAVRELPEDVKIDFLITNSQLGYVTSPGFNQIIKLRHWPNVKVSIDENGFRNNDNENLKIRSILAVGDSFTFGDQVSDRDTWPSCLERNLNQGVTNAGVSGYGAAQAVKRAEMILKTNHYDTVILSVLISEDFHRDELDYFSGFPRPAVIINQGVIEWAPISSLDAPGSKWNPTNLSTPLMFLRYTWRYSIVVATLIDRLSLIKSISIDWTGRRLTRKHPDTATIDAIINFTFKRLSLLPVDEKYVLFQYSQGDLFNPTIGRIRQMAKNTARSLNIKILDSFSNLKVANETTSVAIWQNHHTAYGNQLVCQFITDNLKLK